MKHPRNSSQKAPESAFQRNRRQRRNGLLGSASVAAAVVALMLSPQQAQAQVAPGTKAFKAEPVAVSGTVNISRGATSDAVQVNSPQAIITWRPDDTATSPTVIDILPEGNALGFIGDGNFTVLNRIIPDDPTRAIQFNGGVISLVGGAVGGNVWFYSPGGIIAGPTSAFLVGGLVLTSSNMTAIGGAGTGMDFLGTSQPGSAVTIQSGAQIVATNYVVMWAPRVEQGGLVAANGNVSLIGAEQGTLTVTGGLFDMVIDVGTDDPNGVVHTGITTGGTPADNPTRAITLATVAKNDFVNMLVGGNIGYADASVATASNGVIVLSAGDGALANSGNITIGPGVFNSSTIAQASGDLTIDLDGIGNDLLIGSATNQSDFIGIAADELTIRATSGASLFAADNFAAAATTPGQGGTLSVIIDDAGRDDDSSFSGLFVDGNLILSTFGNGIDNIPLIPLGVTVSPTFGGDGVGGTLNIGVSQGGELAVGGTTTLSAGASAGFGSLSSGSATGGGINFGMTGANSRISLADTLIDVSGNRSAPGPVTSGTTVAGGSIDLSFNSGALSFGNLTLRANADADDSLAATGRANGALGGTITINNGAQLSGTGLSISALGLGGGAGAALAASDAGGAGVGGTVSINNLAGATLDLANLGIDVSGSGGAGGNGSDLVAGGIGGTGTGGSISIVNSGTLTGNPVLTLAAAGTGGSGGTGGATPNDFDPAADGGAGGAGIGGSIELVADGAATTVSLASAVLATGIGGTGGAGGSAPFFIPGNGGLGGNAQGGGITLAARNAGSFGISDPTGTVRLDAGALGGIGGDGGSGLSALGSPGSNGASTGGAISVLASGSILNISGNLVADVAATGNVDFRAGAAGADATGGSAVVEVANAGDLNISGGLWIDASAKAAIGELSAGTARGGAVDLLMSGTGSSFDIQGLFPIAGFPVGPRQRSLYVDAQAYEPQSGNPLLQTQTGGDTFGGAINLAFIGGSSTIADQSQLVASAGRNNPASTSPPASNLFPGDASATGGSINVTLTDSTHQWGSFDATLETYAPGGDATDGSIRVLLDNATLDAGVGFSFSTTVVGATTNSLSDAIRISLVNGSNLTAGFTALYTEWVHGLSAAPVTTGNMFVDLDNSAITSDIFFTSIVPNGTGGPVTGGSLSLFARNGSVVEGDVFMDAFASGGPTPAGGSSRSGDLAYLLDGSTHTGNIELFSFGEAVGADGPGGTAGQAVGGNQNLSFVNGASFTGDIALSTFLGSFYDSESGGALGSVDGGAFSLLIDNGTVDIPILDVSYGISTDTAAFGFAGANVSAPDFSLTITGSQVDLGDASIDLDAVGGSGGSGAAGGAGVAGDIRVSTDAASSLTINDGFFSSTGTGGSGGSNFFGGDGGAGGGGTGGMIELVARGDLTINSLIARARGTGGAGANGSGGEGIGASLGGQGGTGAGGMVALDVAGGPSVSLVLGGVTLDAGSTGGIGGSGGFGDSVAPGGDGGTGGEAVGGTSRFRISGDGANLTFDPAVIAMSAAATGGTGGFGGGNFAGGTAGNGGIGGSATGGTVALEAGSGATLTLEGPSASTFTLNVSGIGGAGGDGGSIDMLSGGLTGDGGVGGTGIGGSPVIRAVGGRIIAPSLELLATGIGGAGGLSGTDGLNSFLAGGAGGVGVGGTPLLEVLDGSPGVLTLGTVVIDASGIGGGGTVFGATAGGQITITDASADPAGLITMGSLTVAALGAATPAGTPSLTISGASGPITVTGAVSADVAGDIAFVFGGNGQFDVGGAVTLNAGGDITLAHTGNTTGVASLDLGTDLIATAGGDFLADAGSIIRAGRDISILAQNIQFASIAAVRDLLLSANNGSITGVGLADSSAGRVLDLEATQAIAIGDVESDLSLALTAGTSVTAGDLRNIGTDTIGDERIDIVAGGDVSLGTVDAIDGLSISGAGLTATSLDGEIVTATMTGAIDVGTTTSGTTIALTGTSITLDNSDAPGNITLSATAGGMALGTVNSEADVLATATGDISFAGLTGRVLTLDSGGAISGGTAAADRAVASGVPRNVNLTAVGDIAIGAASAIDSVVIRGASLSASQINSGTTLTDVIDVLVSGAVDIGSTSSGGQTVLTGSTITLGTGAAGAGASVLTATSGAVDIGTFDSENFLDIVSATTVDFDTLTARALLIDATGDVTGTRAAADVNLISARPRNVTIDTLGAVSVGQLSAISSVIVNGSSFAGTSVIAGSAGFGGGNTGGRIVIDVTGPVTVDSLSARGVGADGAITLSGSSLLLANATADGAVLLTSTAGDIEFGTIDAEGFFDADSAGAIIFDVATGRLVDFTATGDVTGTSAAADVNLTSGRPRNVSIETSGAVSVDQLSAISSVIVSGSSFTGTSVIAGSAGFGGGNTGGLVQVNVTGLATIDTLSARGVGANGAITISAGSMLLGNATADGAVLLTSTAGDIEFGTIDAEGFFDADADGSILFDRATGRLVEFIAGGDITGNFAASDVNLTSGRPRNVTLDAGGTVSIGEASSIGNVLLVGASIDAGIVNAAGTGTFDAAGLAAIADLTTVGAASVTAGSADLGTAATGAFTANITGDFAIDTLVTTGGTSDVTITAGGDIGFSSIDSARLVRLAGGSITGGGIAAAGSVEVGAGSILLGQVSSANGNVLVESTIGDIVADELVATNFNVTVDSAGSLDVDGATAGGSLAFTSATGMVLGEIDAGGSIALGAGGDLSALDMFAATTSPGVRIQVGGNADLADVGTNGVIDIDVVGSLTADALTARGQMAIDAASIELASASTLNLGSIVLTSTAGDVTAGLLSARGAITVDSAAAAGLGAMSATGSISVTTAGDAALADADADGSVRLDIAGNLIAGNLVSRATSPGVDIDVVGNASIASVSANGLLDLDIGGLLTGGDFTGGLTSVDAGSIDVAGLASTSAGAALNVVTTSGDARIGAASALSAVSVIAAGQIIGGTFAGGGGLTLRGTAIDIASAAAGTSGTASLTSTAGDITVDEVSTSLALNVNSAGAAILGNLTTIGPMSLLSAGDMALGNVESGAALTIDAGGDLTALDIFAGTTNQAASLTVGGDATIVSLSSNNITNIDVGGAFAADALVSRGRILAEAGSIVIGTLEHTGAGANSSLTSTTGSITVGAVDSALGFAATSADALSLGDVTAVGRVDLASAGDMTLADLTAGAVLTIQAGGNLGAGALVSGTTNQVVTVDVAGDAVIASLLSDNGLAIDIGGALTGGAFRGAAPTINAGSIDIDSFTSTFLNATATAATGDAGIGAASAALSVIVTALGGDAVLGSTASGLDTIITGRNVGLDSGTVGRTLRLNATSGSIAGTSAITVGGGIDLDASGDIGFGTLAAQGGAFTADAGGGIAFDAASAAGAITFAAGGDIAGGNLTSPGTVSVSGARVVLGDVIAGAVSLASGSDILFDLIRAANPVTLAASNGLIGTNTGAGDIESDGSVTLLARAIAVGDVTSGGSIGATATAGDASFGALDAVSAITIDAAGTPTFASLSSGTDTSVTGTGVSLGAADVGGNLSLTATAGDIDLALVGTEQILVGGNTSLAASGSILLSHTGNTGGLVSLDSAGNLLAQAGGSIATGAGSILSGNEVFLLASGAVDLADVRAVPALVIGAGGDVNLGNALVSGPQGVSNVAGIRIDAGLDPFGSPAGYDNLADVRITGTVDSYASIAINAGGSTAFAAGSQTLAGDAIVVRTGDDIIIGTGALLQSSRAPALITDPANPFSGVGSIDLHAGGLTNLLSIPATPIASLVVSGALDAGRGAVIARANAIDGLDGGFAASSLSFDIDNAPVSGVAPSDDNGLLAAPCLEGNVCLGSIAADNVIAIGQASGNDVIALTIEQGTVNAREIRITTRNDIVMGSNGIATTLNASDLFSAVSRTGDVDLRDAAIASGQIVIEAAGSLLGSAALSSTGDIGITVGQNINAAEIAAGRELTSAAGVGGGLEGLFQTPGDFRVGQVGAGSGSIDYRAGGDIVIGGFSAPGGLAAFTAGGLAQIDLVATGADLRVEAARIVLGDVLANSVNLLSAGDILVDHAEAVTDFTAIAGLAFTTSLNSIITGGDIVIDAGGPVALGNSSAGGLIDVNGSQIDFASLVAGTTIELSTVPPRLTAGGTGDITGGSIEAGAGVSSLVTTAGDIALSGDASADGDLFLIANGGSIALAGQTSAGGLLSLAAGTTIAAGDLASATGDVLAEAALGIAISDVTAAGDIRLLATAGGIGFANLAAGRDASASAAGDVAGVTLDAGRDGDLQADRDSIGAGDLVLSGLASAVRNLNLYGANVTLADVAVSGVSPAPAGRLSGYVTINSTSGSVLVGDVTAPGMTIVSEGGDLVAGNLNAFDPVVTFGLPTIIDLSAFGGDITVASLDTVGDVAIFNESGALTRVLGTSNAGNDLVFSGSGDFRFDGSVTTGRDLIGLVNGPVAGNVVFGAGINAGRNVGVVAANGTIALLPGLTGPSLVGGNLAFSAREIGLSAVEVGGDLALTAAAGSIDATEVGSVGGAIALIASDDVTFGALAAGGGSFVVDAGGTIAFVAAESSDTITMTAAGALTGGDLAAPGTISLDAASIAIGDAVAGAFGLVSGSDILFDSLQSGGAISLSASGGTIGANGGPGDIASGADVTLLAQSVALRNVTSGGSIGATATTGDASFGALDAVSALTVDAAGTVSAASVGSGGSTTISGASISLASGSVGGDLRLLATSGDIGGTSAITVGGGIDLDASGDIGFGTLAAQGGAFTADAGGGIAFDAASAAGAINFAAGGDIAGGNLTSPGTVSVSGARVVLGDVIAGAVSLASGSDILFDLIRAANPVTLAASNGLIGTNTGAGDIESGSNVTLLAQSIALGLVNAGGSIAAGTSAGDMTFARLEAGSNIALDSAGGIDVGHAEAGGNFTAAAAAAFVTGPDSIITGGDIVINAGGPVTLGNSSAGGLVDVTGSQIDFAALVAGETVTLLTEPSGQTAFGNGNVTGDSLTAGAGASSITSTFGSVMIAGDATVGGGLSVVADADIALGAVNALGGNLLASAGGDIAIGTGSASGDASLTAGQSISLAGDLDAGGTVALLAQTGAIAARDLIAGAGVSAISAADMALRDVILSGGGANLVSGGDIAVRDVSGADGAGVSVTADGSVDFSGIDSADEVSLLAETGEIVGGNIASGAGVTVDGEAVTLALIAAAGEVSGTAGSGAFSVGGITSTGGAIDLQGATAVTAGSLAAATDLTVAGGAIDLGTGTAGGSVTLASGVGDGIVSGALVAGNAIAIDAGTGGFSGTTLVADGALTVASAAGIAFDSAAAGASVGLTSGGAGDIAATTITAGADVNVATGGSFIAGSVTASQSGTGVVDIAAVTGITLNTVVGNTALLAASGGAVRVNVDIDMTGLVDASGQSVFLRSTGNLAALANASSDDIDIETSGDLDVSAAQADAGNVRLISSGGNATVANVRAREFSPGTGGNVLIEADENLAVTGEVTAASALTMRAGERASVDAAAVGREIELRASDVAIGSSGALGSLEATETIDISGGGIARIGGDAASASGFTIDNDEFSRIAASQSIAISASTAIVLDDLDIRVASGTGASGNLRGEGRVDFRAAEGIDVIGEVVLTGATADNAIGLETGGNVFLDASTGLLEVNDGSGNFLGSIEVVASNFYAMTEQALTDVQAAADIAAIDDRLAQNDGIDNPDGLIRTGTLDITTVTSDVFIQNTAPGTRFGERRGFTVDELLVSDPSGTNQPIVINGIIAGATGVDAVTLAQISSAFDPGSTINGCLIANPAGCSEIPEFLGEGSFPVQDLIEEQLAEDTVNPDATIGAGLLDTPLFELREAADGRNDPLIDDPVTGAGNEDLWAGECEGEAAGSALCAEPAE